MAANTIYRTFKNMDGPGICLAWNRSWYAKEEGKTVAKEVFNQFIASKLFFDPAHLVVAVEPFETPDPDGLFDGRIIGFVHGGFGPNQEMNGCDKSIGYIAMLVVEEREDQQEIRERLLYEMEKIFFRMGIRTVFAGAVYPNAPFYMGRPFGCELNGILENDPFLPQILLRNEYHVFERHHIMTSVLSKRIPLTFSQCLLASDVEMVMPDEGLLWNDQADSPTNSRGGMPISRDWWEVCAHSNMGWNRYILVDRKTSESIAWVCASPMTQADLMPLMGLHHLYVKPSFRHQGYASLLLIMVLNQLQMKKHACKVELLVSEKNNSALQMFTGLHFEITSTGNVYRRELPADFPETFQMKHPLEKGTEVHA